MYSSSELMLSPEKKDILPSLPTLYFIFRRCLIEALKDKIHAAAYLTAHLEDEEPEPGLLELSLSNVFEALGEPNMSAEDAKLHLEKLDVLLSGEGSATIYALASWLKVLGLKLSVAVDEAEKGEDEGSVSATELAEVGNV